MSNDLIALEAKNDKAKAEALFFVTEYSPEKIAAMSGCSIEDVLYWIFGSSAIAHTSNPGCWFYKKEIQSVDATSIAKYREVEPILIAHTKAQALGILTSQMAKKAATLMADDADELGLDDLKRITEMYEKIDKIDRLEQGRATNITETKLDRMDATDVIGERRNRSDYMDVVDAEFKEG